jgi:DNA-binding XRE family transcriptional regulator
MSASTKIRASLNAVVRVLSYHREMEDRAPNHLRAWRKTKREGFEPMTQQELADALGTAKSVISDLERGVVQLSDKWLRRLAPVLKTQPGYILDYDPGEVDNDIIDIWSRIDVNNRPQAARILRALTGTND